MMQEVVLYCNFKIVCLTCTCHHLCYHPSLIYLCLFFYFYTNCALNVTSLHKSETCVQVERHLLDGFEKSNMAGFEKGVSD